MGGAVGQRRVSKEFIESYPILIPPFTEQQRIVRILDEAFDSIATAKANAEKNLHNAPELFESVLNSAVSGSLTSDWRRTHPNIESAAVLLKRRLTQRRSHQKAIGEYKEPAFPVTNKPLNIPYSWALASPDQIATHIVDCPHSTPKWAKSGVLCLRTTNFKPGHLDLEFVQFVSEETYNERIMRLEPKPGDVVYSREGGILGIACIIPEQLKLCLGQRMMLFRLDTTLISPEYFTAVLNSTLIHSEVKRLTGGAASPHLNVADIKSFPIPLPPIVEQLQVISQLGSLTSETQHLESIYQRRLAALEELKKSLLHQAFNGDL
jgi:type I restriction enzyme S subunit